MQRAGGYDVLFKKLLKKRIDAVPQVRNVGNYFLRMNLSDTDRAKITYSPTVIQERKYHIIFSKQHETENLKFKKLFAEGLQQIKANGRYNQLLEALNRGDYDKPK